MEVHEVGQRIFRVHRLLISAMLVFGLAAATGVHVLLESRTYSASARLNLGGAPPQSTAEAAALAGTVQGIVTSPDLVGAALAAARLNRDSVRFAAKDINTQPFSSSGILQLTVTDTDPIGAAVVANQLAADAVATLNHQSQTAMSLLRGQLQADIDQLTAQLKTLDAQLAAANVPQARQTTLLAQRSDASQRLATLVGKQADIQLQAAQQVQAVVVDAATPPDRPDPSRFSLDLILGVVGGAVAGLGGAALRETVRPTAVGRHPIERALGAPVLGTVSRWTVDGPELVALSDHVRRAAREARVSTVLLWSPHGDAGLGVLAQGLQTTHRSVRDAEGAPQRRGSFKVAVLDPTVPPKPRQGVLAVVEDITTLGTLETVADICRDSGRSLIGAVLQDGRRGRRPRRTAPATAARRSMSAMVP
jgi:capsular polysaccharide biosynthesis protein